MAYWRVAVVLLFVATITLNGISTDAADPDGLRPVRYALSAAFTVVFVTVVVLEVRRRRAAERSGVD